MAISYIRPDLYRYPSRRSEIFARQVVATSQPLAVEAGVQMLRQGGNAVDAALAAAICLTVVEPTGNGIGSDAFAIVGAGNEVAVFNGSGRAPAAWTPERFAGLEAMPAVGWDSVTIPGAVDAWVKLSARFGILPFAELFAPAIHYARDGFAVTPVIQRLWQQSTARYGHLKGFRHTFMPGGSAPAVGETFRCPDHAASLEAIAASGGDSFYRGDLAAAMVADAGAHGASLSREDLANHEGFWSAALSSSYGQLELLEPPPNGQGLAALTALGILRQLDLERHAPDSVDAVHLQIEAMKRGVADASAHVCDPDYLRINPGTLLETARLKTLARAIDPLRAASAPGQLDTDHGTVYIAAGDADGTLVSLIQSNYQGFGSGIVVPGTGISLQNRAAGFSLDPGHPNRVGGRKRPFHTIIPGFLRRDGLPLGAMGVMGGHMQPQGHLQLLCRLETWKQGLQEAIDAPRWRLNQSFEVDLEPGFDAGLAEGLAARGHVIADDTPWNAFGGAQAVLVCGDGYRGASDPRKDGCAAGF